jgi:ArsR family transcriptional regulator
VYQNKPMPSIVKILRAAADPTRLRILLLLKAEELSVAELQEILVMGQSTISTHLSQLKQAGLVGDRRTGKSSFYSLATTSAASGGGAFLEQLLAKAEAETPHAAADRATMRAVVKKRQDKMRAFFDTMAGRVGKDTCRENRGRAWPRRCSA